MDFNIKDIIAENKKLLESLYASKEEESKVSTVDLFRSKLLGFIDSSLSQVQRTQMLLDLVDGELIQKLALHEYDKNELISLRESLVSSANSKTSTLLEPFKPTNNGGNSLITPPSTSATDEDALLKSISPEQRQALHKLAQILEKKQPAIKITKQEEEEGEEE